MLKKKYFRNKKKYNKNNKYFLLLILFLCIFFYYYYFFNNEKYFVILPFNDSFYVIPKNKGGQIIPNQDKKGLHLSYEDNNEIYLINDPTLKYSIQLMTHDNYFFIKRKRDEFINSTDSIYLPNELFIAILKNNLGSEYFLLYKNFPSRLIAFKHCEKYVNFVDKCLIVNVQNF